MRLLRRLSLAEARRRPGRVALNLLGIVIGVATVVAIQLSVLAARRAYDGLFATATGGADLEVVAAPGGSLPAALPAAVRALTGVRRVSAAVEEAAAMVGPAGTQPLLIIGAELSQEQAAGALRLVAGKLPGDGNELLLPAEIAAGQGLESGDSIDLWRASGRSAWRISGLAAGSGGGQADLVAFARIDRVVEWTGRDGFERLRVFTDGDRKDLRDRLSRLLPAGSRIEAPEERDVLAREATLTTDQGLAALSLVSLVAGAFVILNTVMMSLGERRRQLAILRAIGTTPRRVRRIVLREALVLSFVGTALGLACGVGLARSLLWVMRDLVRLPLAELPLSPGPFVVGGLLGIAVTLLSAYWPVLIESRRPPLAALVPGYSVQIEAQRTWAATFGVVLVVVVLGGLAAFLTGAISSQWLPRVMPAMMAVGLGGFVLSLPWVLLPSLRLWRRLLYRWLGMEGRLAGRQLERRPRRLELTAGVLFLALAVSIGMGHSLLNSVADIDRWYDTSLSADFFLRASVPDAAMLLTVELPEELGAELEAIEGVERIDRINFVAGRVGAADAADVGADAADVAADAANVGADAADVAADVADVGADASGGPILIMARTFAPDRPLPLRLESGDPESVRDRVRAGAAVLGAAAASQLGLAPGDMMPLETSTGTLDVAVAATSVEMTAGGLVAFVERSQFRDALGIDGVGSFIIEVAEGRQAEVESALRRLAERDGLLLQSNREMRAALDDTVRGTTGFLWLLLVLVFVVAFLGVVNTLAMNVLEQQREIALLRAVAFERRQVRRTVTLQALIMGLGILLPGTLVGVFLAWVMNVATAIVFARPFPFVLEWPLIAGCAAAALAVAVAAALLPARRAARVPIMSALHYE